MKRVKNMDATVLLIKVQNILNELNKSYENLPSTIDACLVKAIKKATLVQEKAKALSEMANLLSEELVLMAFQNQKEEKRK